MDKNQLAGLLAMLALLVIYFYFFAPDPAEYPREPGTTDSSAMAAPPPTIEPSDEALGDSSALAVQARKFGSLAPYASGTEETFTVATDLLTVEFSNKGGRPVSVILNNYTDYRGSPMALMVNGKSEIDILFEYRSKSLGLNDLYFAHRTRSFSDSTQIDFFLTQADQEILKQTYTMYIGSYEVGYSMAAKGFEKLIDPKNLAYTWFHKANRVEPDTRDPRNHTTVRYREADGTVDYLSETSTGHEEETLNAKVDWVAFKQKFFTSAILSRSGFSKAFVTGDVNEADTTSVKYLSFTGDIPYTDIAAGINDFKFYFGPNIYDDLHAFAPDFDENLNLGWSILAYVNQFLILPIWRVLESFIPSYPLLIVVLVIIIRIILSPLTYKSHISMAKMKVLKPELDKLKEKYGDDMQKVQQEQMALYQKVGINPLSGCIPMLLQFPILVSLFYFIPNAIELRQVRFLWAHDLSTYDSILNFGFEIPFYGDHISLFTLLMTVSTLLYTWSNSQMTAVQGPMKSLQYIMPVMLLFFFNGYAAGLTFYYLVSNLVSFGQIYLFRTMIDDQKIKRVLEENKKKNANKKKSKFQMRIEEAMKANEQAKKKK